MSDANTPQTDADRIRNKRLAKLGGGSNVNSPSSSSPATPIVAPESPSTTLPAHPESQNIGSNAPTPAKPSTPTTRITQSAPSTVRPIIRDRIAPQAPQSLNTTPKSKQVSPPFSYSKWEEDVVENVFGIALDKGVASRSKLVWLKALSEEIKTETPDLPLPIRAKGEYADRLLIARLELDPQAMVDDPEQMIIQTQLPSDQTCFEYLVGCWKRLITQRSAVIKRNPPSKDLEQASALIERLRELIISYAGLTLQEPSMFPQPQTSKPLGAEELLPSLYALNTSPSTFGSSPELNVLLNPSTDLVPFLTDLGKRFHQDGLEDVLGEVHTTATLPPGLSTNSWRSSVMALECLCSVKPIASMITSLPEWNPPIRNETTSSGVKNGNEHERTSILGMVMRLGIFARDWPMVLEAYYKDFDQMNRQHKETSDASLRATLNNLQLSLFNIVNAIVRAGQEPREAFLAYVARVVELNRRRAAMQFKYEAHASDSFIHNLHYVLLRLAEPFMDAQYKQLNKIDLRYYERSKRISLKDLTRINATPPEIEEWENAVDAAGPAPNFVSDVFYLLSAINHLSTGPISNHISAISRHVRDIQRELDIMEKDESWRGTPAQPEIEMTLKRGKAQLSKMHAMMESMYVAILQDDFTSRSTAFASFVSVWLLHLVDPSKKHPQRTIELPLPQEVPLVFKVQPEYMFDDVVELWDLMMKYKPTVFLSSGQKEIVDFAMAFLTSTWYITNPYLKSKIVAILAIGVRPFPRYNMGILGNTLCTHPLSLRHLMMCLMSFYVECEKTGTHTQFYDKFQVMQSVWKDPVHHSVMSDFTRNMGEFVKFANRLMNDVTFMLDELLSKLVEIKKLQLEMARKEEWDALTQEQRDDKMSKLRSAEGIVESWVIYSREFLALLIEFTDSNKAPFVSPEIVGRLAAMLNYVLDQLAGPRCADLKTKDLDKYKFDPREMLSKVLQIYINLSSESAFIQAIATEGRSYRKGLFDSALHIARSRVLKSPEELDTFARFAVRVEEVRLAMDEEDITEYPEEFEGKVSFLHFAACCLHPEQILAVVDLSTIKSHLLSDPTDPFNRVPLKIEDVIPSKHPIWISEEQPLTAVDVELKEKIDRFVAEYRAKAASAKLQKMEEENAKMDTTE
ncbi:hypothetical protein FRC17_001747 [Serendipita sp. 399]|nr:hypothetical protein FRC17_001747 [Serendipita sp. 399]